MGSRALEDLYKLYLGESVVNTHRHWGLRALLRYDFQPVTTADTNPPQPIYRTMCSALPGGIVVKDTRVRVLAMPCHRLITTAQLSIASIKCALSVQSITVGLHGGGCFI